jgi:Flp pilus assembly protein TadG
MSSATRSSGKLGAIASVLRSGQGQSLTEFALLGPVLLFLTLGVADLGRAFYYKEAVSNTTRQVIRLAVLSQNQSVGDFACANFGGRPPARNMPDGTGDAIATLINAAANESSDGTNSVLKNTPATTIDLDWNCISGKAATNSNATSQNPTDNCNPKCSDSIRARIDYSFQLITPLIGGLFGSQTVHIRSDIWGRSEY